ncbi:tegument protein UL7 [Saimiriine betaherpesvirus 4]|uniref:Tegument protein UL7 n=1 Tax=Saimiriine betaherpesvirus 4 TaxID=1535247 RepID=G8XT06_9BETA|nr:tegument protein UL7 [Saimiriine betaherpesvirus 4]AEV80952.1 tegument protein UL7 [Saimiriine betaherpesvirus 4]
MDALMIRGVMEVHCEDRETVYCMQPEIIDITHRDHRLWVHTDHGTLISMHEYYEECQCRGSWLGYSAIFLLDTEDTLSRVKLSAIRIKHRCAVIRPSNLKQFTLCIVLSCVENLALTKRCLQDLRLFIREISVNDPLDVLLLNSCRRLICTALYLFFDHPEEELKAHVPRIFVLYLETRTSYVETIARLFLRLASLKEDENASLCLMNRTTNDDMLVSTALHEVLNESYPNFYKHFVNGLHPHNITP